MSMDFERYLVEKNDELDNMAYELLRALATPHTDVMGGDTYLDWDMELIGELLDSAEEILRDHNIDVCHPYYTGDEHTSCIYAGECKHFGCTMRRGQDN